MRQRSFTFMCTIVILSKHFKCLQLHAYTRDRQLSPVYRQELKCEYLQVLRLQRSCSSSNLTIGQTFHQLLTGTMEELLQVWGKSIYCSCIITSRQQHMFSITSLQNSKSSLPLFYILISMHTKPCRQLLVPSKKRSRHGIYLRFCHSTDAVKGSHIFAVKIRTRRHIQSPAKVLEQLYSAVGFCALFVAL